MKMFNKNEIIILCFLIITMLIVLTLCNWKTIIKYSYNNEIEITVKDKYINYDEDSKYLVVDSDNNTYEITDLFFKGKFNSTDIYNQLEIGKTYKIKVSGKRIRYCSMYKNINEIIEEK